MHQFAIPIEFALLWLGSPQPERKPQPQPVSPAPCQPKKALDTPESGNRKETQ